MTTTVETTGPDTLPVQGDRFECKKCGMQLEIIAACNCEQGLLEFFCCGQRLTCSGRTFVAETTELFIEHIQTGMEEQEKVISSLKEKAERTNQSAKEKLTLEVERLTEQYEGLRNSLQQLRDTSGDAWKNVATGCSKSWEDFKTACQKAASRY